MSTQYNSAQIWIQVCQLDDIAPSTGACVLLNGHQIALFRIDRTKSLYAISNYDPFSKVNVLSRGIIANIGARLVVASPLYKHHFDLGNGLCLQDETVKIPAYYARVSDDGVEILCSAKTHKPLIKSDLEILECA